MHFRPIREFSFTFVHECFEQFWIVTFGYATIESSVKCLVTSIFKYKNATSVSQRAKLIHTSQTQNLITEAEVSIYSLKQVKSYSDGQVLTVKPTKGR